MSESRATDVDARRAENDHAVIPGDLACLGCGYNLRTLAANSRCPECGEDVGESLKCLRWLQDKPESLYSLARFSQALAWIAVFVAALIVIVWLCGLWLGSLTPVGVGLVISLPMVTMYYIALLGFVERSQELHDGNSNVVLGVAAFAWMCVSGLFVFVGRTPMPLLYPLGGTIMVLLVWTDQHAGIVSRVGGTPRIARFASNVCRVQRFLVGLFVVGFFMAILGAPNIGTVPGLLWLLPTVTVPLCIVLHTILMFRIRGWLRRTVLSLSALPATWGGAAVPRVEGARGDE